MGNLIEEPGRFKPARLLEKGMKVEVPESLVVGTSLEQIARVAYFVIAEITKFPSVVILTSEIWPRSLTVDPDLHFEIIEG